MRGWDISVAIILAAIIIVFGYGYFNANPKLLATTTTSTSTVSTTTSTSTTSTSTTTIPIYNVTCNAPFGLLQWTTSCWGLKAQAGEISFLFVQNSTTYNLYNAELACTNNLNGYYYTYDGYTNVQGFKPVILSAQLPNELPAGYSSFESITVANGTMPSSYWNVALHYNPPVNAIIPKQLYAVYNLPCPGAGPISGGQVWINYTKNNSAPNNQTNPWITNSLIGWQIT